MSNFELARKNMVSNQLMTNHVYDSDILEIVRKLPRHLFVNAEQQEIAYFDGKLNLGGGRFLLPANLSCRMIQALELDRNSKVLEIASGSGYATAILAGICGEVVGIETINDLATQAAHILSKLQYSNYSVKVGDLFAGAPEKAPYDAILINGKVNSIPRTLLQQLKNEGRLVCIEQRDGTLAKAVKVIKYGDSFDKIDLFDAAAEFI